MWGWQGAAEHHTPSQHQGQAGLMGSQLQAPQVVGAESTLEQEREAAVRSRGESAFS